MHIELVSRRSGQVELHAERKAVQIEAPAIWRAWWQYCGLEAVAIVPDRCDLVADLLAAGHDLELSGYVCSVQGRPWAAGELFA